jgi:hypothetical protein
VPAPYEKLDREPRRKGQPSKIATLAVLLIGLFVASLALNGLEFLRHMGEPEQGMDALVAGHVYPLLLSRQFWHSYGLTTLTIHLPLILNFTAAIFVLPLAAAIFYVFRVRLGRSLLTTGILVAHSAIIPVLVGVLALRGNTDPSRCGPWLATDLAAILYASLICAALAAWQLRQTFCTCQRPTPPDVTPPLP